MNKRERHRIIRDIVETRNVETQEDLALALQDMGITVTQATVSRDIKELNSVNLPSRHRNVVCAVLLRVTGCLPVRINTKYFLYETAIGKVSQYQRS